QVRVLFLLEALELFVGELVGIVIARGRLQEPIRAAALPQAEPQAVLDRGEVVGGAGPQLARRHTAQRIDAGRDLALLVGSYRGLPRFLAHGHSRRSFAAG